MVYCYSSLRCCSSHVYKCLLVSVLEERHTRHWGRQWVPIFSLVVALNMFWKEGAGLCYIPRYNSWVSLLVRYGFFGRKSWTNNTGKTLDEFIPPTSNELPSPNYRTSKPAAVQAPGVSLLCATAHLKNGFSPSSPACWLLSLMTQSAWSHTASLGDRSPPKRTFTRSVHWTFMPRSYYSFKADYTFRKLYVQTRALLLIFIDQTISLNL